MSYPSRKWGCGVCPRFHLVALVIGELKEMGGRRSSRLPTPMVDSFSADLLPAIKNYWTEPPFELCILLGGKYTKLLHIMQLLLKLEEEIDFLCVFVAETVLLLSLLLCILLWWWCVKIAKWTGSINANMRFHSLNYSLNFFLSCFATQSYVQIHM